VYSSRNFPFQRSLLPPPSAWWWRQQWPLKCWKTSTRLYGATTQKTAIFVLTTVRTKNPIYFSCTKYRMGRKNVTVFHSDICEIRHILAPHPVQLLTFIITAVMYLTWTPLPIQLSFSDMGSNRRRKSQTCYTITLAYEITIQFSAF
jgi:hypothetical protein